MTTIRAFPPQIRALFSNFRKRAGETSSPPLLSLRACNRIASHPLPSIGLNKLTISSFGKVTILNLISLTYLCPFLNTLCFSPGLQRALKVTSVKPQ